ncbi:tetratricopeptide repeat protein [Candidatus Cyanaurora vandensis]|uniref:tetratricopeptide repeat protein n=1 Tax=Candidatus Cyanaurora vandensis TaxID=2714958 RepID=UPI00257AA14F|nr:tetratricopeptide repeat protein [Candidatus Cyanaurora vandensis]
MAETPQDLLTALQDPDEAVRAEATQELWQHWFTQKGAWGLAQLSRAQTHWEAGELDQAEKVLTNLVQDQPDFAEAWNRRAVLYYLQGQYPSALHDCERVLALVPVHFGALHGQGLCYAALGEYALAIQSFRRALTVQPHALVNQKLILECTALLS